ncbi:MAG TPA: LpqB family beta-propeller domain-containing protein [Vicinamibacteria bacterium]|nr:LpqB family beta-propeller domain-containing protein [Vicinamibacteria bacterium]
MNRRALLHAAARALVAPAILAVPLLAGTTAACLYSPPAQLPSSVRILYSKHDVDSIAESTDIWFIVAREGNELRLTQEEGVDTQPYFAPGLRRVFFTRRPSTGRDEIWSMDLDGNDERRILGGGNSDYRDPAVSPDDRRLAYTIVRDGRPHVMISDVDGANPQPLLAAESSQPSWSPDGRTLAVVSREGDRQRILLVSVAEGVPRPLSSAEAESQTEPDWSPDGARIAFTQGDGPGAEIAVATVADGEVKLLTDNDIEDRAPAWSTTGERIAFVSRRDGRGNLWLVDPDGENLEDLTDYDEDEGDEARDPDWL